MTGAGVTAARVVVAGGHSAGHIEPAMNVADALRRLEPTAEITALGTVRGLDTTLIPARGYQLELIPPVPLPRALDRGLLRAPGRLRDSARAAGAVLDRARAEVVVGFGGYVAAPAYLAARRRGLPVVVDEANGLRPDGPVLMVTGGSQGARVINDAVSGAVEAMSARASVAGAPDADVVLARHVLKIAISRRAAARRGAAP